MAGVAHEINTPIGNALTSITWIADRIGEMRQELAGGQLRRDALDEFLTEAAECTGLIRTNVERTARIVQTFKQIAADSRTDAPRRFFLRDHLEDLHIALAAELTKAGQRLRIDCPKSLELIAPPGALTRVLAQLLQNAMSHAFPAGTPGQIAVTARPMSDGSIRIDVADDGAGIAGEAAERLFDPFFTTARSRGHIGLGLATVHNLVRRALAGEIEVESSPGQGTRVRITLPGVIPVPAT